MERIRLAILSCGSPIDRKIFNGLSHKGGEIEVKEGQLDFFKPLLTSYDPQAIVLVFNKKVEREKAISFIGWLKKEREGLPVICISPLSELGDVVATMKEGAYDYFKTPIDFEKLKLSIRNAARVYQLTRKVSILENQVGWKGQFDDIVGVSSSMQEIFQMVQTVAKSHATVLVLGESGTGKELIAKAIHRHSERVKNNFIDINCGAIPRELLENELFGHEKGSYTGADRQYIGSCERADGGTLFLDEISEMDPSLQVKLLRVLQERSFTRVGGTDRVTVDIRIIAATNKDILAEVQRGAFREDLYYRLNVVPILIPPLRSRREDVPFLARHFLEIYSKKNRKRFKEFTSEALETLVNYDWPGNVRELENAIERLVVLHDDTRVRPQHLPRFIHQGEKKVGFETSTPSFNDPFQKVLPLSLVERYAIQSAVTLCGGDIHAAARKLEVGQATLYRKLKKYGVVV
ncbi:MAG: sigma-54 dependent transcriptional regulator [Deltaproteobacteria bacterium]|nr:sigma-54 dependent transcriptional regulator [Deltaproteobacteria bacterium]